MSMTQKGKCGNETFSKQKNRRDNQCRKGLEYHVGHPR